MNVCDTKTHIKCIGCGACTCACPFNLISINTDEAGFYKAYINDIEKCVNCGKCLNVCPAEHESYSSRLAAFYGFAESSEDRSQGTSGGIFTAIARKFIENGGIVFGAVFNNDNGMVYHTSSEECDISLMSKSKYVQSNLNGVFAQIKILLENNRDVDRKSTRLNSSHA